MQKLFSRRGAEIQMLASLILLALVAVGVAIAWPYIWEFFAHNLYLNGVIVLVFLVGLAYPLYSLLRLQREFRALGGVYDRFGQSQDHRWLESPALSMMKHSFIQERMLLYSEQVRRGTAPSGDSHSERVYTALGLHTSVTRYIAGLLVFLGLLGTFIGLLMSIGSIQNLIGGLPTGAEEAAGEEFFAALKDGLARPLGGMATAFSTSVFGLVTSLIVGFVHLQLASAQNRYISRLEAFDSAILHPSFAGRLGTAKSTAATGAYLVAAQRELSSNLERLVTIVERTETMQANYRDIVGAVAQEIEMTNAVIGRLAQNQDLIRESSSNLVDLTRHDGENQKLTLAELKNLNETLARLNAQHQSAQESSKTYHNDLVRTLRREFGTLSRIASDDSLSEEVKQEL